MEFLSCFRCGTRFLRHLLYRVLNLLHLESNICVCYIHGSHSGSIGRGPRVWRVLSSFPPLLSFTRAGSIDRPRDIPGNIRQR